MFIKNHKIYTTYYLIFILIIAAFFRLYNIAELPPGLYPDEAMNGNNALESLATNNFKVFYPENNGREGLFINIQAILIYFFGNEPWVLRVVSALFGILTVLGVHFLAKELFYENTKRKARNSKQIQNSNDQNSKPFQVSDFRFRVFHDDIIALLSSFFIATSFWHINFSRIGFRAIMAPFFLTWGVYFLLKSLNNCKLEIKNWKLPILGGLAYGLGFHSYIAYRATPALILIIIALYWFQNKEWLIRKKILLSTLCFLLFTIIVASPLLLYFYQNPQDFFGRTTQISVFNSPSPLKDLGMNILKTAGMFNFSGDYNWRHNIAGAPLLFWPIGIFLIIGIFVSIHQLKIRNWKLIIPLIWLAVASLPVIISNEGLPHALRAILMAPPIFILAAIGGTYFFKLLQNLTTINDSKIKLFFFSILTTLFLIISTFQTYYTYFIKWKENPNVQGAFTQNYVDIGRQLNALPKELPKYVLVQAGGVNVRGLPMPTQTTMFITDTFTPEKQKEKNIFYILPNEANKIPQGAYMVILE